jgi:hypothetical protein
MSAVGGHFLDVGVGMRMSRGRAERSGAFGGGEDLGLEGLELGEALALGEGLGVEGGVGGGDAEDLGPALLGGIEVAADFKEAGVFDVGGQEAGGRLVDLVQEAEGAGEIGELGGGGGFGQEALGFFDAGIGGGNGREIDEDGIGVGGDEVGFVEDLEDGGGGDGGSGGGGGVRRWWSRGTGSGVVPGRTTTEARRRPGRRRR